METITLAVITGETYSVRDKLIAMGALWHPTRKVWLVPLDKASEAQALVPVTKPHIPGKCDGCGGKVVDPYKLCYDCWGKSHTPVKAHYRTRKGATK